MVNLGIFYTILKNHIFAQKTVQKKNRVKKYLWYMISLGVCYTTLKNRIS